MAEHEWETQGGGQLKDGEMKRGSLRPVRRLAVQCGAEREARHSAADRQCCA